MNKDHPIIKLTEKIHLLRIDFEILLGPEKKIPRFVNVLIIFGEKITLIDTGTKQSEDIIFNYILQNGRNYLDINTIILSHAHPDHIGSAARIKELTGCKVLAHRDEIPWIQNIELQNQERPVPGFLNLVGSSVMVDAALSDGQALAIDQNIHLKIIHSPGHSKGSINIFFLEDRILFTADSLPLKNDIPNYDNYPELIHTLEKIKNNDEYQVLVSSWTPPMKGRDEIMNLIRDGEEYLERIDRVVKGIYSGTEPEPLFFCKSAVVQLGLPPFLANPLVDKTFRSHLN